MPERWPMSGASELSVAAHSTGSTEGGRPPAPAREALSGYAGLCAHPARARTQSWGARPCTVSFTPACQAQINSQRELLVDLRSIGEDSVRRADVVDSIIERDAEIGRLIRDRDCESLDSEHLDEDGPGRFERRLAVPDCPQLGRMLVLRASARPS